MADMAEALPEKRLFIHLITRDISLEDAILDLIDNSINSILQESKIDLEDSFDSILSGTFDFGSFRKYRVAVSIEDDHFRLEDNCGGITYDAARKEVFHFGRAGSSGKGDTLSVYGIGLKRALFKLGDTISLRSYKDRPFDVSFSATDWEREDKWELPLEEMSSTRVTPSSTRIDVRKLTPETAARIGASDFLRSLRDRISNTYCFYINRFCRIAVNGVDVEGGPIAMGAEESLRPANQEVREGNVTTIVMAGLAPREDWIGDRAGWHIFCNGRAVIFADRSELTGWGDGFPMYVSKFRGFRGMVFFFSKEPELLPWTTTKTDINKESTVYQRAINLMYNTGRPVMNFLSSLYSTDEAESVAAKAAAAGVRSEPIREIMSRGPSTFVPPTRGRPTIVNVQFTVKIADIDRIRQHLRNPSLSSRRAAEIAFKYYLENEVG